MKEYKSLNIPLNAIQFGLNMSKLCAIEGSHTATDIGCYGLGCRECICYNDYGNRDILREYLNGGGKDVSEFKLGDRVEVAGEMYGCDYIGCQGIIERGYTPSKTYVYTVRFDDGDEWNFYPDKLKLIGKKKKTQTTKENNMKDNGIDSNVLAVFGDKVKGNELVVIDRHFTETMITQIVMEVHHKEIQAACKDIEAKRLKEEAKKK